MKEIIVFNLENDQDLVLAHRRSMQLGEMCGLGLVGQTSFATAVSEVARFMIENGNNSLLTLSLDKLKDNRLLICASISSPSLSRLNLTNENFQYAKKLVSHFEIEGTVVTISSELAKSGKFNQTLIDRCKQAFKTAQAISPYEEVKRKNTELQRLADSLTESENRYQELTNSLPLMMFIIAADHQMLYANHWFLSFTGKSMESLRDTNWLKWVQTQHLDVDLNDLRVKLDNQEAFQLEIPLSDQTGEIWHLLSLTPQFDSSGKLLQWFGFIVNIQAQKVIEQTLRDNKELRLIREAMEIREKQLDDTIMELNRSNQELARYAYVASHDLQEPIRKVRLLADMVIEKYGHDMPSAAIEVLTRLKGSSERMQQLVKDLLDYSKINAGSITFDEEVDLSKIIKQAEANLEHLIRQKDATIMLPDQFQVTGNSLQLVLVFQNLLANAIKFTAADVKPVISIVIDAVGKTKELDTLKLSRSKGWLRIQITDNGIGFEQQYAEKIFEVFQRLHSQKQYDGTGIGLSICKKIVEMHGGVITASSVDGSGSTFTFYLPQYNGSSESVTGL